MNVLGSFVAGFVEKWRIVLLNGTYLLYGGFCELQY